jgi:competence protein ComEA
MQQRVIIIVLALMVSLPFVLKSRKSGISKSRPAAFSVSTSCKVMVRVRGDVRHAGIYEVGANTLTQSVINMAEINGSLKSLAPSESVARTVVNGADLNLKMQKDGTGILSVGTIPAGERIVMGIPLDINFMDEADFRRLPGIGPVMARRIIEYRQKNGDKMKVEELIAVEGIGEMRYQKLSKYF